MHFVKIIFVLALSLAPSTLRAAGGVSETTGNSATNGTGTNSAGTRQTTPTVSTPQTGINQAAKQGNSSQMIGGLINGAVGAGLIAWGVQSKNNMMIMMGVMALGQAAATMAAAGQSSGTGDASVAGWGDYSLSPGSGTPVDDGGSGGAGGSGTITPSGVQNQIKDGLKALSGQGIQMNVAAKTVTMPDGTVKSFDDFKDANSMAAAGMSPAQTSAALAAADKLTKDAVAKYGGVDSPRVVAVGVETGGGDGGAGYGGGSESDSRDNFWAGAHRQPSAADKARMIAGKSILAGGEPIGVKGDDIFQMIHRHYDMKRRGNEFIVEVAAGERPVLRNKASIQRGFTPAPFQRGR